MATRKKKTVGEDAADAALVETKNKWPKIVKGSHLTVKTFKDGRTELIWDDEVLLNEVRNAILQYESSMVEEKPKKSTKGKKKNVST